MNTSIAKLRKIHFDVCIFIFYQLSKYSSCVDDLWRDSDEEVDSGKKSAVELPFQENSYFKSLKSDTETQNRSKMLKRFLPVLKKMHEC